LKFRRTINLLIALIILIQPIGPAFILIQPIGSAFASQPSQDSIPMSKAQELLEVMSPEEKIGQLFLLQFDGTDTSSLSEIAKFVTDYHIGGVVLNRDNDNFSDIENLVESTFDLNKSLQTLEYESSLEDFINFQTQAEVTSPRMAIVCPTISSFQRFLLSQVKWPWVQHGILIMHIMPVRCWDLNYKILVSTFYLAPL